MRILFVTHTEMMGGANYSLMKLMLELREHYGVIPVVLMPKVHGNIKKWNFFKACQDNNIECLSLRYYWFKNNVRIISYLRYISNILWYPYILFKLRGRSFDIIHSNSSVIGLGAFISRRKRTPHVWHLREFGMLDFGVEPLFGKKYEKWLYGKGDVFIAISNAVKEYYLPVIPRNKLKMVYNGVTLTAMGKKAESKRRDVCFCMVGLISSPKNQIEALQAVNILVHDMKVRDFHLTFIGFEEPQYTRQLRSYVEEKRIQNYVTFMGERKDVNELLERMDVGLMLSKNEAFGRVTVEYMMHGLAVIASDSGANREIVSDGETGFIYTLGDCKALAMKMKFLIEHKAQMEYFSGASRERATTMFTSTINTKGIYNIYLNLLP